MTSAVESMGIQLQRGNGASPESFTTIAEVKDISGPEITLDTLDVTTHSSSGHYEEVIPTILRSGEVTFDVNWVPADATHQGLITDRDNRTKRTFTMIMTDPGTATWTFAAYVTKFAVAGPVVGVLGGSITLKITGQPTLTY